MKKIESFSVNHVWLQPGVYVSRKDVVWENVVTTFDLRMKKPNVEPVIDNPALHAMEHLWATFLRNHEEYNEKTIYFGPMGCRTWFYSIFQWDLTSEDVLPIVKEMIDFIVNFEWKIPGQSPEECGNYLDLNLPMAIYEAKLYKEILDNIKEENMVYPK